MVAHKRHEVYAPSGPGTVHDKDLTHVCGGCIISDMLSDEPWGDESSSMEWMLVDLR
jgi:hypothetical protein